MARLPRRYAPPVTGRSLRGVHVGLDLAWSTRGRTGLAVVDGTGALRASGAVRTDDDVATWLAVHAPDPVTVAVDAPIVVTNPTGMRTCERLVGQTYGRYGATCHPSNPSRPYLAPPRAAVLAARHGWESDPDHRGHADRPAAIEVYPHAAMVGLFGLSRVLPYKRGALDIRRRAFLRLLDLLETIGGLALPEHPRWQEIRLAADRATRPVELGRIEDEVDAILCAHLAWLWHHRPSALRVFGDCRDGFIVAPPPPTTRQ